jgi:hypothetical protein
MAEDTWTTRRKIPTARSSSVGGVAAAAVGTALPINIYAVGSGYSPSKSYEVVTNVVKTRDKDTNHFPA